MGWLKALGASRSQKPLQADAATGTHILREWKIQSVRDAISRDWIALSAKNLPIEKRRAVREHLEMNVATLRALRAESLAGSE